MKTYETLLAWVRENPKFKPDPKIDSTDWADLLESSVKPLFAEVDNRPDAACPLTSSESFGQHPGAERRFNYFRYPDR